MAFCKQSVSRLLPLAGYQLSHWPVFAVDVCDAVCAELGFLLLPAVVHWPYSHVYYRVITASKIRCKLMDALAALSIFRANVDGHHFIPAIVA